MQDFESLGEMRDDLIAALEKDNSKTKEMCRELKMKLDMIEMDRQERKLKRKRSKDMSKLIEQSKKEYIKAVTPRDYHY